MEVEFELIPYLSAGHRKNKVFGHSLLNLDDWRNTAVGPQLLLDLTGVRQLHPQGLELFAINVT